MTSDLRLSEQELAFFRLTLDLFPTLESPLRYLEDDGVEAADPEKLFAELVARRLLAPKGAGAADEVRERLVPVGECNARVVLRRGNHGEEGTRSFYLAGKVAVEHRRDKKAHLFGEPLSEAELARRLVGEFTSTDHIRARPLAMSAGDYLVFAVFARDLRAKPEVAEGDEAPMSIDEVLAFFDEPETKSVRTPSDESWQESVDNLCRDGVLVQTADGYALHPSLHAVARQIVAARQCTVMRFDFLDEHWLVREVSLYPTDDTVYRLGSQSDGAVRIEELSTTALEGALVAVVATLPDLLNPDLQPMQKGAALRLSSAG